MSGLRTPQPGDDDYLLTVKQIATYLHVCPMTVYRLIHEGELGHTKIGRSYRVRYDVFMEYLKQQTQERKAS